MCETVRVRRESLYIEGPLCRGVPAGPLKESVTPFAGEARGMTSMGAETKVLSAEMKQAAVVTNHDPVQPARTGQSPRSEQLAPEPPHEFEQLRRLTGS
jgi:hypothetical protein